MEDQPPPTQIQSLRELISEKLLSLAVDVSTYFERHQQYDWGSAPKKTKHLNDVEMLKPIQSRQCVESRFRLPDGSEIRIVTNFQLGITCALLTDELKPTD